jgi:hypothetical protein
MHENWIEWSAKMHQVVFEALADAREEVSGMSPEELADLGWVLKKMYANLDDIRKEIDKLKAFAERVACAKATAGEKDKIHGRLAVGTPDVEIYASLPHPDKDPENWKKLCDYFGIPDEVIKHDLLHSFHWPSMTEFITKQQKEAKPLPPGINPDKTGARFYLKYRGRKKDQ